MAKKQDGYEIKAGEIITGLFSGVFASIIVLYANFYTKHYGPSGPVGQLIIGIISAFVFLLVFVGGIVVYQKSKGYFILYSVCFLIIIISIGIVSIQIKQDAPKLIRRYADPVLIGNETVGFNLCKEYSNNYQDCDELHLIDKYSNTAESGIT